MPRFKSSQSLADLWAQLRQALANPNWSGEVVNRHLSEMVDAGRKAKPQELTAIAAEMAAFIASPQVALQEAGIVAMCAGTVSEQGGAAGAVFPAILGRLPDVLTCADRLAVAVAQAFPGPRDEDAEPPPDAFWVGDTPVPRAWIREFVARDRDAVGAFSTLENWCLPVISIATRDRVLLRSLVADANLKAKTAPLAGLHGSARFLEMLLLVPLQERLFLLDARSGRVFELVMDGVTVNFSLHSLLSAALAAALGHESPPRAVIDVLHGSPSGQEANPQSFGTWNLYTWRATKWLPHLNDVPWDHWVWNEGLPADIPALDGTRLVIAGPPTIERYWNTCRTFASLAEDVQLVRELEPAEAERWIERMKAAAAA
jgi:hypothetical protein